MKRLVSTTLIRQFAKISITIVLHWMLFKNKPHIGFWVPQQLLLFPQLLLPTTLDRKKNKIPMIREVVYHIYPFLLTDILTCMTENGHYCSQHVAWCWPALSTFSCLCMIPFQFRWLCWRVSYPVYSEVLSVVLWASWVIFRPCQARKVVRCVLQC